MSVSCMIWIAREDFKKYKFFDQLFSFFHKGFNFFEEENNSFWPFLATYEWHRPKQKSSLSLKLRTDQFSFFLSQKKSKKSIFETPYLELSPTGGNPDILKSWNLVVETNFFCKIPYIHDILWPS